MQLQCPMCRGKCGVEAWDDDKDIQRFMRLSDALPGDMSAGVWEYLALFRPFGKQSLRWKRAAGLLKVLGVEMRKGFVQTKGRPARPAPEAIWREALERITSFPPGDLPLKNHNYLKSIVYTLADKADREAEVRRNAAERQGVARVAAPDDEELIPLNEMVKRYGALTEAGRRKRN